MYVVLAVLALAVSPSYASHFGSKPHIIHIVGDDIGHNDFNFTYGTDRVTMTPTMNALAKDGVVLSQFYTFKLCAPSRAMMMTGRYTFHFGYYDNIDADGPNGGVMLNYTLTPHDLKQAGYNTHGIGKWHCGFRTKLQTPTFRGFDSWLGYMHAEENYYSQMFGAAGNPTNQYCNGSKCCGVDLLQGDKPNEIFPSKLNGTYSTFMYTARAVSIIENNPSNEPLYIYLPFQNIHGPTEAPDRFLEPYKEKYPDLPFYRSKIVACLSALDEGVANITAALKQAGMWENTVLFFNSDNGGDVGGQGLGMNNYPLRGGKWTHWEGGTRVVSFVHSELIPQHRRGTHWSYMAHTTDLRPTWAYLAGTEVDNSGPYPVDGVSFWEALIGNTSSDRNEIVHQVIHEPYNNATCTAANVNPQTSHVTNCAAAIRIGPFKLMLGYPGWPDKMFPLPMYLNQSVHEDPINRNNASEIQNLRCHDGCLFNVEEDPSEINDIKDQFPEIVANLTARLAVLGKQGLPRRHTTPNDPRMCQAVESSGYWIPYQDGNEPLV
eukprot:m.13731 g.13731  ORF g.13731 m.13731 type:complete len:547 (+) comp4913_c0_seq1:133-1773(+)